MRQDVSTRAVIESGCRSVPRLFAPLGFTREVNGSGPFGRCILCSCNNRSTQCEGETGVCTNCQVGTHGDRCQLCSNNVLGPECTRCKIGYWGLSANGCQGNKFCMSTALRAPLLVLFVCEIAEQFTIMFATHLIRSLV